MLAPRAIAWLLTMAVVALVVGCDDPKTGGGCRVIDSLIDLSEALCGARGHCTYVTGFQAEMVQGGTLGIDHCGSDGGPATLFGGWRAGPGATSFEWRGPVRTGGVFPFVDYVAAPVQCTPPDRCSRFPSTTVAASPTGFDWARLQGDDVFIPLGGQATIESGFHATASLDAGAGAGTTIRAEGLHGAQTTVAAVGDTFAWGRYLASVVRVVPPQDGVLGPIGWVEIRLSEPVADAGKRR